MARFSSTRPAQPDMVGRWNEKLRRNKVSLENVAVLLGNTLRVAEKHYEPWVKSRQDSLTAEVEKAWKLS